MTEQPTALRLADDLAKYLGGNTATQAAAELRRLAKVEAQRDALLEALRKHVYLHDKDCVCEDCAAIKQAEENT